MSSKKKEITVKLYIDLTCPDFRFVSSMDICDDSEVAGLLNTDNNNIGVLEIKYQLKATTNPFKFKTTKKVTI